MRSIYSKNKCMLMCKFCRLVLYVPVLFVYLPIAYYIKKDYVNCIVAFLFFLKWLSAFICAIVDYEGDVNKAFLISFLYRHNFITLIFMKWSSLTNVKEYCDIQN